MAAEYDAAEALPAEGREAGLDGLQGAEQAGFELEAGLLVGGAFNRPENAVSGVADDGVQMPLLREDLLHGALQGRFVIDIEPDGNDAGSGFLDGTPAGAGIDGDARFGEQTGRGGADAAAAA